MATKVAALHVPHVSGVFLHAFCAEAVSGQSPTVHHNEKMHGDLSIFPRLPETQPIPHLMDRELSMATTTWYCRLLGLVRRSQILSLRNWLAMYGMICEGNTRGRHNQCMDTQSTNPMSA